MAEAQFVIRARDEASPVFQRLGQSAKRLESTVNSIRFGAIGAGVAAIAGGFSLLAKGAIDAADELDDLSQKVGISVERLSELKFLLDVEGVSTQQLQQGLKALSQVLTQAGNATSEQARLLEALGVTAKDPYEALLQVADALAQITDPATKSVVAVRLLGKAGLDMIPALNGGSKAIREAAESARRLGLVISGETASASARFNDSLAKLQLSVNALGIALSKNVVGGLANFTEGLVEAKEQGRLTEQIFRDILGTALELGAKLPLVGTAIASLRDTNALAVADAERRRAISAGILSGAQDFAASRNAVSGFVGPKPPSDITERASCVLSGGTWDAARRLCVPKTSPTPATKTGAAGESLDSLLAKAAQKRLEIQDAALQESEVAAKRAADELIDIESRASLLRIQRLDEAEQAANDRAQALRDEAQQWREIIDPVERYRRELERINALEADGALSGDQANAARDKVNESVRKLATDAKETRDLGKDIGFAFASSFEEAVVAGKKLSDVVRGLGADIAKILLRETVTKPIASSLGKIIDSFATGGSFMVGGSGGTDSQLVAFRATPNERVTIETPGQQSASSASSSPTINNYIDARGADSGVEARLQRWGSEIISATLQAVQSQADRGGSFARSVGRR